MKKEKQLNKLKKQDSKIKYREYIKKRIDDTKLRKKAYEEILDLLLNHNEISDEDVDSILKKFHK